MSRSAYPLLSLLAISLLAACGGNGGEGGSGSGSASPAPASPGSSSSSSAASSASSASSAMTTASRCNFNAASSTANVLVTQIANGLENPWGLAFLPDGRMLVTERPGRMRIVQTNGAVSSALSGLPTVHAAGQGGLLDVILDPDFASNNRIYFSYSETGTGGSGTAIASATLSTAGLSLGNVTVLYRQTPKVSGDGHYGSRLVMGADGKLYAAFGDRQKGSPAQNPLQTIGKIVRINPDGSVPTDNPFVSNSSYLPEIWSLGHRNPQGMTRHPTTGQLWTAEHGAMGGDELNTPEKGKNYGWPTISYGKNYDGSPIGEGTAKAGMEQPRCYWDPSIAPGNLAFYSGGHSAWAGNLFVAALKDTSLNRLTLSGTTITGQERISIGKRVRDVRVGPDGWLYLVTDEAAGQILRISVSP